MKKILVISHMANIPGCCQAEWIDDRIYEFLKREYQITVISGSHCFKYKHEIKHYRVPSILPYEAKAELNEIESMKIDIKSRPITIFYLRCMRFISKLLDRLNISLFKGEGRWFWMFSSLAMGLKIMPFKNYNFIYTTGGPASAHLSGILLSKIFRTKLIVELQDPLTGEDIGRNRWTIKGLKIVEKFIVSNATNIVYATKNASLSAKEYYPKWKHKIDFIYPGAKKLKTLKKQSPKQKNKPINFSYIGSLYQTRNLDNFFSALQELSPEREYEVNLYGWIAEDILERIIKLENSKIKIHGMIPREQAIANSQKADILLLVQHTDRRSSKTIPFKLYDYLNSGNIIFGLTYMNQEIDQILETHGHITSDASSVEQIKENLTRVFKDFKRMKNNIKESELIPSTAVNRMEKIVTDV